MIDALVLEFARRFGVESLGHKVPIDLFTATRADLARLLGDMGLDTGVEIGVEQGVFSSCLLDSNPRLQLYSIDAWKAYRGYRDHVRQAKMDGFYKTAVSTLSRYGPRSEIIRSFSTEAVTAFQPNSLGFCYIDGNHAFDFVMEDLIKWGRCVRPGGIIAGHDYIRRKNISDHVDVVPAVQAYTSCHNIDTWFTVGGESKETRSFFFVKP